LTRRHFRNLGLMLLVAGIAYLYFTINNFVGSSYVTQTEENALLSSIFGGKYSVQFWAMISVGMIVPCVLLALPMTRTIGGIVTASVLVNIGMWVMRYVIVVPTLSAPFLPLAKEPLSYFPTVVEWSITAGGFAAFMLFYILFSKVFPIISIWELGPETAPARH
jgi:Ni/Fe-hydrogenase subunit HybB-like protein